MRRSAEDTDGESCIQEDFNIVEELCICENPLLFLMCSDWQEMKTQGRPRCGGHRKLPDASPTRHYLKMTVRI